MTPRDFAACFAREKEHLLALHMTGKQTPAGTAIAELGLSWGQKVKLRTAINDILTDAFYTVLLALDGTASIGGKQMLYTLRDDKGREITGKDLEAHAYEYFHGSRARKPRGAGRRKKTG